MKTKIIDLNRYPRVDLDFPSEGKYLYTQEMFDNVRSTLDKGESVLIFYNRKGAHRLVVCDQCGSKVVCDSCNMPMMYSGKKELCLCNFCNISKKLEKCGNCGYGLFEFKGVGTEKLEEDFKKMFNKELVERWDADSGGGSGDKKNQIYIGTTLLTKGHDFPDVSLVVVLNFDQLFAFPGFRSSEKALQTLLQVSGRSGRRGQERSLLVQTFNPESKLLKFLSEDKYGDFLEGELDERKILSYPPFGNFVLLSLRHKDESKGRNEQKNLVNVFRKAGFKNVYSPTPYREFYHGKYTFLVLLKGVKHDLLNNIDISKGWKLDREPSDIFEGLE